MKTESIALDGTFAVMPLEELFQWLDQSGRAGLVSVSRPDGYETWIAVRDRHAVAISPAILEGALSGGNEAERVAVAFESVLDLFALRSARFHFEPRPAVPPGGLRVEHPLGSC